MYEIWKDHLATCNLLESMTPDGWIIVDVRDLKDGTNNDIEAIKVKIEVIANLLSIGQKVTVRCCGGISRSNTIACAVMTFMLNFEGRDFDYHWGKVKKACPRALINRGFLDEVKVALKELGVDEKKLYYDSAAHENSISD